MDNKYDDLVESAFSQTEAGFREKIFSKSNSVLVPIWLISDLSKYNLTNTTFLENQSPYIDKGLEIPEKIIPTIIDKPLYFHKITNKYFFLKDELSVDFLQLLETNCSKASLSDIATNYSTDKKFDWTDTEAKIDEMAAKYDYLDPAEMQENMKLVENVIDQLTLSPNVLNYLDDFSHSDWSDKYDTNMASLMLAVSFAKTIPGFNKDDLKNLISMLVFKDIGYSRLSKEIQDYELLHPLVSYRIVNEANSKRVSANSLSSEVLDSILKQHEFIDGSGALASREHPLVINKEGKVTLPVYAQISGVCELFNHYYQQQKNAALAFVMLKGMCLPIGNTQGKYDTVLFNQFESFYKNVLIQDEKSMIALMETSLNNIIKEAQGKWQAIQKDSNIPGFEKIQQMIQADSSLDNGAKITKLLCILRALAHSNKTAVNHLIYNLCPYPPEFLTD